MTPNPSRMIDVDYRCRYRVRWRDTDTSGFANFGSYVRMMEETEYAFLRSLNLSIVMQDERGIIGFPRVSAEVEVQNAARLDEDLEIWLQVILNNGVKIEYRFEIARGPDVVATGTFLLACCRFPPGEPPRAILIPDFFLQRFPQKNR